MKFHENKTFEARRRAALIRTTFGRYNLSGLARFSAIRALIYLSFPKISDCGFSAKDLFRRPVCGAIVAQIKLLPQGPRDNIDGALLDYIIRVTYPIKNRQSTYMGPDNLHK
jgi:hypothetical protein